MSTQPDPGVGLIDWLSFYKEAEMVGLMGVQNDGKTLVAPNGKVLFAVPSWMASRIQRIQHRIAQLTWR